VIRIAITPIAYAAIAATLTLGTSLLRRGARGAGKVRGGRGANPAAEDSPPAKADKRARRSRVS
jgi:hypothetical protein